MLHYVTLCYIMLYNILIPVEEDSISIIAIAVGAVAGVAVLVAIGAAIGIFFLCFYYPHK